MNDTSPLAFPRSLVNRILHLAQQHPEREVCGLIGSRDGRPVSCYPVSNVAEQADVRFQLDGAEQITAMREMRDRGEQLFAIFHSHPSAPAEPSPTDLANAAYPDALHLIVSLGTAGVLELRGFRFTGAGCGFTEVALGLTEIAG